MSTRVRGQRSSGARRRSVVVASFAATVGVLAATAVLGLSLSHRATPSNADSIHEANGRALPVPTQRWLVPDAEHAKIRPAPAKAADAPPATARPAPDEQVTANGPAARRLLGLMRRAGVTSMLPAGHPAPRVEDRKVDASPATGEVTYAFADGSLVTASQQQLTIPLPYSVVGLAGGAVPVQASTGTQVVLSRGASFIQVLLISSSGVLTQVTARGVPAQDVPIPLTEGQLRALAEIIDRQMQRGN